MDLRNDVFALIEDRLGGHKGNYESTAEILDDVKKRFKEFYDTTPEERLRKYHETNGARYLSRKEIGDEIAESYYRGQIDGVHVALEILDIRIKGIYE
jgi:hypothetical protein